MSLTCAFENCIKQAPSDELWATIEQTRSSQLTAHSFSIVKVCDATGVEIYSLADLKKIITTNNYSHLKTFIAIAYKITPQSSRMLISCQTLSMLAPSKEISRMALLKCVSGNKLQKNCNHFGKTVIGKNVPDNKSCGNVKRFAKGGMALSFFARLLTIKP